MIKFNQKSWAGPHLPDTSGKYTQTQGTRHILNRVYNRLRLGRVQGTVRVRGTLPGPGRGGRYTMRRRRRTCARKPWNERLIFRARPTAARGENFTLDGRNIVKLALKRLGFSRRRRNSRARHVPSRVFPEAGERKTQLQSVPDGRRADKSRAKSIN